MILSIKQIDEADDLVRYLECVQDLNSLADAVDSLDGIKQTIRYRPSNIITFVGYDDSNQIVATATIILEYKLRYNRPCGHIEDVATHPNHRHKGYASAMVGHCVEWAKKRECYKIKLNCEDKLVDFYKSLGFINSQNHMIYSGQ